MTKTTSATCRSTEAYTLLRQDLSSGTFEAGSRLALTNLQDRYGFGAMPLREALNRLTAEQFVQKHDQRGFSVPALDAAAFLEIQNARIVIEGAALAESIASYTHEWEDRLVVAFHHLTKASGSGPDFRQTAAWSENHGLFHKVLISGCPNRWLVTYAGQLYEQSARYRALCRQIDATNSGGEDDLLNQHREIMDAAIARDTELATRRLIEHYRRSVEVVLGDSVELSVSHPRFYRRVPAGVTE